MENTVKTLYEYLASFSLNTDLLLNTPHTENKEYNTNNYDAIVDEYFDRLPFSNLSKDTYTIRFGVSGTELITQLFEKYVDSDTLIISTQYEHENVRKCLDVYENKYLLNYEQDICKDIPSDLIDKIKSAKNVFVYVIGTQISTGEITPQSFFIRLKKCLEKYNVKYTLVLDDVHGMFFVPRDYSLFDHILYTAHAIVPVFDMGMLISRKNNAVGDKITNWPIEYLPRLDKVLTSSISLGMFKNILLDYFSDLLRYDYLKPFQFTVNHIFALRTNKLYFNSKDKEELKTFGIIFGNDDCEDNFVRIRFQEFLLQTPENAIKGLEITYKVLLRAIELAKVKGGI